LTRFLRAPRHPLQVYNSYRFGFDRVYGPDSTQEDVYAESARSAVNNVLQVRRRLAVATLGAGTRAAVLGGSMQR
jgi:hypothetical protein